MRAYTVFNVEQADGLKLERREDAEPPPEWKAHQSVELAARVTELPVDQHEAFGDEPQTVRVGAQRRGQHPRIPSVVLRPRWREAVAEAVELLRIDRVDRQAPFHQALDHRPARCLDRHADLIRRTRRKGHNPVRHFRQPLAAMLERPLAEQLPGNVDYARLVRLRSPVDTHQPCQLHIEPPIVGTTLVGSVGVGAFMAITGIVFGDFDWWEFRILLSAATIAVASICGLACGAYLASARNQALPLMGITLAIAAAAALLLIIWTEANNEVMWKTTGSLCVFTVAVAQLCLLSMAKLAAGFEWSLVVAYIIILFGAALIAIMMWFEIYDQEGINSFGELPAESGPSRFVPCAYRKRLAFGLWPEYDSQRHASAQQFGANVSPGNRGLRVFDVFRPPTVELDALRLAKSKRLFTISVGQAFHSAMASSARSRAGSFSNSTRGLKGMFRSSHGQHEHRNSHVSPAEYQAASERRAGGEPARRQHSTNWCSGKPGTVQRPITISG